MVCREFVPLRKVGLVGSEHAIPKSFEFRTFWWKRACVGFGEYWASERYQPSESEREQLLAIAGEAARRIDVTFLVVDIAQAETGEWVVIEVNDGQDSGYGGVPRRAMWQRVVEIESKTIY